MKLFARNEREAGDEEGRTTRKRAINGVRERASERAGADWNTNYQRTPQRTPSPNCTFVCLCVFVLAHKCERGRLRVCLFAARMLSERERERERALTRSRESRTKETQREWGKRRRIQLIGDDVGWMCWKGGEDEGEKGKLDLIEFAREQLFFFFFCGTGWVEW